MRYAHVNALVTIGIRGCLKITSSVLGAKGKKMPRLIDADAWDSELISYGFGQAIIGRKIKYTVGEVRSALAKRPTVDAVEVVRCKDCINSCPFTEEELKYPYRVGEWHCEFWFAEMHGDDYCSCGKRRKNEL